MKWPLMTLGQLASFRNGLNFGSSSFGVGLKVINVADFKDRSVPEYESVGEIDPQGVADDDDLLADGDIIFVRSNGNRDLVGRSMLIRNPAVPVSHSAFTIRLRFEADGVLPAFYSYFFRSPLFRKQLSLLGAGTNICNLNQRILRAFSVPVPPRAMQDAVVAVLSTYDELIESNRRRMALLEEATRLLYQEWFVHLRFPGYENTSTSNGVPEGWERSPLGTALVLQRGFDLPTQDREEGEVPI
jgi:type I restriction enzyme S subunit